MANSFNEVSVLCINCDFEHVVHNNKPPKFCSECGERLQSPIISANRNTKAVNESVEKLEEPSTREKFFDNNKSTTDLSTDSPNNESCSAEPSNNKLSPDNNPSSTMPPNEEPPDHSEGPCEKAFDDKLTSYELSDDDPLSDIPLDDTPLGHIPCLSDDNAPGGNKPLSEKDEYFTDNAISRKVSCKTTIHLV